MTALTTSSQNSISDPYISQTDGAEVTRLQNLSAAQGLGDTVYAESDEEMTGFMQDLFGLGGTEGSEKIE